MHTAGKITEKTQSAAILFGLIFAFSATAHANVTVSPTTINFGNRTVGTTSAPTFVTLTNTERRGTRIVSASLSADEFSYSGPSLPVFVDDGDSVTFSVRFAPTNAQAFAGTLVFKRSNGSTIAVALRGRGVKTPTPAQPPAITSQPVSRTVTAGQTASFSVGVKEIAPLTYQWSKNGRTISGAASPSYTTPATTTSDNGAQFTVVVTNSAGRATSTAATLTVMRYTIKATPSAFSLSAKAGGAVSTQSISINGTVPGPLQFTLSADQPWITLSGAFGTTQSGGKVMQFNVDPSGLAAGNHSGHVFVTASGVANSPLAVPVTLTVSSSAAAAPTITTQPSSKTVTAGQTAMFTVAATGTAPMAYQWKKNGTAISGATSSTYTTPVTTTSDNAGQFNVVVTNSVGSATSSTATLAVNASTALLNASSTALSFGNVTLSASSSQNVTLTNAGNSNITISNVSVSGAGFNATGVSTGFILTPGQTATLKAIFTPAGTGSVTGGVSVMSNATNSPDMIALSGTGLAQVNHSVSLSWTPSTSTVIGYNSYSRTISGGPYTKLNTTPIPTTTYTDTTVQAGLTYYYVVTAIDSNNVESAFSTEVSANIP